MPTPTGLPRPGEYWVRLIRLAPDWEWHWTAFKVLERSRGDMWSMRVQVLAQDGQRVQDLPLHHPDRRPRLWTECAWDMSRGNLRFLGKTVPEAKAKLAEMRRANAMA